MATSTRKLEVVISGDARGANGALASLSRQAQDGESKLSKYGKTAGFAFAAVGTAVLVGANQAIDAASNLGETLSKSNTVFKESGREIESWAGTAAKSFGQSKQQALEAASSFGNMFIQLGIGRDEAAGMSMKMTELASDFASFHNADITEVLEAQSAAFRGEYDSVQKFVPTINAAAVEQKAMAMGLAGTTKELTAQDKALATQQLLLEGAGDAMGDYDRTSGSLANQQRALGAQFEDIKAKVGQALIPIMAKLTEVFSGLITFFSNNQPALIALAAVVGTALVTAFSLWAASMVTAATSLTILGAPVIAIVAAIAAVAAGVVYAYTHFEAFRTVVDTVGQFLTTVLWPALQQVASFITGQVIPVIAAVVGAWVDFHLKVGEVVVGVVQKVAQVVSTFVGFGQSVGQVVGTVIGKIGEIVSTVAGLPGRITSAAAGMWNGLKSGLASVLNAIIRGMEWMVNQVIRGINSAIDAADKIAGPFVNFGEVSPISLPRVSLHTGGIVPGLPGQEIDTRLLAGEGVFTRDQMKALGGMSRGGGVTVIHTHVHLDGQEVGQSVTRWQDERGSRNGYG